MGNCSSSCLGSRNNRDTYEEDEEACLFDDPGTLYYGSFDAQYRPHDEEMEAFEESEALQRVVAETAENMVDVFEIVPERNAQRPAPLTSFAYAGQEARLARYQNLLSKLSMRDPNSGVATTATMQVDWLPQEKDSVLLEPKKSRSTGPKTDADKPLVGTFLDAAAAMN